jgi:thioesterase domain-containing protein
LIQHLHTAARETIESRLRAIWLQYLPQQTFAPDTPFFDLGGSARDASSMLIEVERSFGCLIPLATLLHSGSFEDVVQFISGEQPIPPPRTLVPLHTAGTKPPFFCVHGVHGGALTFRRLTGWLGDDQPLYAFEARGFDSREKPLKRLEHMADLYLQAMRQVQARGPYFLCGYSFGGRIAYTMAQKLRQQGEAVPFLALLDTHFEPPARHRYHLLHWRKQVIARLRRRHLPPLTDIERSRQRVEHANYLAAMGFVPRPYDGAITYLSVRASRNFSEQPPREQGWANLARGGFALHDIAGEHLTMFYEQHLPMLAETLTAALRDAQRRV